MLAPYQWLNILYISSSYTFRIYPYPTLGMNNKTNELAEVKICQFNTLAIIYIVSNLIYSAWQNTKENDLQARTFSHLFVLSKELGLPWYFQISICEG